MRRTQLAIAGCDDGREQQTKECRQPLEARKGKKREALPEYPERNAVLLTLLLWPSELYTSELHNCNLIHLCCF